MMKSLRVLIIPDKFKGTLTGRQAAQAMARGWRDSRPGDELDLLPMSDGGDGFGQVISELVGAEEVRTQTVDAAHRPAPVTWWWQAQNRLAIIESARVIGLAMLPPGLYHPFSLDTRGLAAVLGEVQRAGAMECLMGIGGSATNEGGFGLARALGWEFYARNGELIQSWTALTDLERVAPPPAGLILPRLRVAVDVQNPLLGKTGCSRIYGPQKGLREEEMPFAEACLHRLAQCARPPWSGRWAQQSGAGAAGGLGFGLRCFCRAELAPGFRIFARLARLPSRMRAAHLVVTGEGKIDASSLMGKGVGEVLRCSLALGKPCYGLAGGLGRLPKKHGFTAVQGLAPDLTSEEDAKRDPQRWLQQLAAQVARTVEAC